jgi:hypothetical protein
MLQPKEGPILRCENTKMYTKKGTIETKEASFYLKNRTIPHPVITKLVNVKILIY